MSRKKRASEYLREYQSDAETLDAGVGRVRRLSSEPMVAVGVLGGSEAAYLLVLPDKSISRNVNGVNLKVSSSRRLTLIDEETGNREIRTVTAINFRFLSYASEVLLDILVDEAIDTKDPATVGELAEDFLDLFVPSEPLSRSELLGYWGEIFLIWQSQQKDVIAGSWHRKDEDRYDFSFDNDRLEVKATEGSRRVHSFSSSQIPAPDGVNVLIGSLLTNEVSAGMGFIDLYEEIISEMPSNQEAKFFGIQFARILARDPEGFRATLFDIEMARASLKFYDSASIPRVTLDQGVMRARWTADLENVREARMIATRSNRLVDKVPRDQAE